jgi:hypothetical protein
VSVERYALDTKGDLEAQLCHLCSRHTSPQQELKLGGASRETTAACQGTVPERRRWEKQEETLGRVEVHNEIAARDAKPGARRFLDDVTGDVVPGVVGDCNCDQSAGMVVILSADHVGYVGSTGVDALGPLGRGARAALVSLGKAMGHHAWQRRWRRW